MAKELLTEASVKAKVPGNRDIVVWDARVRGFGLKITPAGNKVFFFYYRTKDQTQRRPRIGEHPSIKCEQARAIAQDWYSRVAAGGDPSADRQASRRTKTVAEFWEEDCLPRHFRAHNKPRSVAEAERNARLHILPHLGSKRLTAVTDVDVRAVLARLASMPGAHNKVRALLSVMFAFAETEKARPAGTNPCRHIKKLSERERERFLSAAELAQLAQVLDEAEHTATEPASVIAAVRLLLFTGARLSEILTLRWENVEEDRQTLRLPDSKTGAKTIYLSAPARDVLVAIPRVEGNPFVIVGRKPGTRLSPPEKAWRRIRERATVRLWREHPDASVGRLVEALAGDLGREPTVPECRRAASAAGLELPLGMRDVRLHDLRHTFASIGAASGLSLPLIGKLLGHAQPSTTARYAHLLGDPMQQAANAVGERLRSAMAGGAAEGPPTKSSS